MGINMSCVRRFLSFVSTSKPGESLCGSGGYSQPMDGCIGLNLQAWRIPLWVVNPIVVILLKKQSQPPSLENPFVGCGQRDHRLPQAAEGLNLQAWRIPLWVIGTTNKAIDQVNDVSTSKPGESLCGVLCASEVHRIVTSQPPSLENPFVGTSRTTSPRPCPKVSTSKPGESLCGVRCTIFLYFS